MKKIKKVKKTKKIIIKLKIEKKKSKAESSLGHKKIEGYSKRYSKEV
jgi:hypothetical protein